MFSGMLCMNGNLEPQTPPAATGPIATTFAMPFATHPTHSSDPLLCPPNPPHRRHQISLYAHITKLAFALDSIDEDIKRGTISTSASGAITSVSIEVAREDPYEVANRLWAAL